MEVALATCARLPELDADDALLRQALADRGIDARPIVWNASPDAGAEAGLCVLRETWDYHLDRDAFLAWTRRVAERGELCNGPETVRWNTHKFYLRDLAEGGAPVVPTQWLRRGTRVDLGALARARGWERVVIKPAVGAGSHEARRADGPAFDGGQEHLDRMLGMGDALVQPYLASLEREGECSLVFIEGAFTHAVRRPPGMGAPLERLDDGDACAAPDGALRLAEGALRLAPEATLYARVDIVRDDAGDLRLAELELVEPTLFLRHGPGGGGPLADAIARRVARRRSGR